MVNVNFVLDLTLREVYKYFSTKVFKRGKLLNKTTIGTT